MSDNPEELFSIGVDADQASLQATASAFEALFNQINDLYSSAAASAMQGDEAALNFANSLMEIQRAANSEGADLDNLRQQVETLNATFHDGDAILQQYMADIAAMPSAAEMSGAGAFGDSGGDTGGGDVSGYGLSRGLSSAGMLARQAGAGEVGDALRVASEVTRVEQAFGRLGDQLPGVTEGIGSLIEASGGLDVLLPELTIVMGAGAVAIAAVDLAQQKYNLELKTGEAQLAAALKAQNTYYTDQATMTEDQAKAAKATFEDTTTAQQRIAAENIDKIRNSQTLNDYLASNAGQNDPRSSLYKTESDSALANERFVQADKTLKPLADAWDAATKSANTASDSATRLAQGLDAGDFSLRQAAADAIARSDQQIQRNAKFAADDKLTTQAAYDKITALEQDRLAQEIAITRLQDFAKANNLTGQALLDNQVAIKAHEKAMTDDTLEINHINQVSLGLIQTRKDEAQAIKDADQATKDYETRIKAIVAAQDAYDKAIQKSLDTFTNSANDLALKEKVSEQQYQPGSTQDTFARQTIALKEQTDVAKIEEDTANKIEDIRTKLGETEARIITDYNRQLFDDQIKAQDSIQKAQIDAQRTAVEDQISYQERIADIERSAHINEQQALLDRNFLQITKDELNKNNQIQTETDHYSDQEEKLQRHLANQEQDIQRNLEITEAQQQTAEQRKLADAETAADNSITQEQTTEKRKIEVAQDAQQKALADLSRNEIEKLTLMREGEYQQWSMLGLQENQREQLAAQTEQQIVSQNEQILAAGTNAFIDDLNRLNAMASGGSSGSSVPAPSMWQTLNGGGDIATFAGGGDFQAGQPFMMSEAGIPEFLNIGSDSFAMNAPALVYPLASGSVTHQPSQQSNAMNNVFNIYGVNDAAEIARTVETKISEWMHEMTR